MPERNRLPGALSMLVVVGSREETLTLKLLLVKQGHKSLVADVVVTPDGSKALTISSDMTARLWSLQDGLAAYGCGHEAEARASPLRSHRAAILPAAVYRFSFPLMLLPSGVCHCSTAGWRAVRQCGP